MTTLRRRTNSGSERDQKENTPPSKFYQHTTSTTFHDPEMSCRDRTNEFLSAVKSLQSRQGNGVISRHESHHLKQKSQFNQLAKKIGRDLANTYSKLEKLTILAKRKSLFDDKPIEIQELTYIIKQDIGSLNQQIADLQLVSKSHSYQNGRHIQKHSNTVVVALQSKLATMSNDFKSVLEVRTENLRHQKTRRDQFSSHSHVSSSLPPSAMGGHTGSVLLQDEAQSVAGGDVAINMDGVRERVQQQALIEEQDKYIEDRASTMQNIEQTIVELGGIFTQLAHMVKEQEEMVQRIDSNVDDTHSNVEAAHGEILKYFQSVTSNRWLMIKVFGVLIVFFIIFIVFLA